MNWLAHLFLSQPDGKHRLGNLFGDLIKGKERRKLNSCFNEGIRQHLLIDSFTDCHPIVKLSKQRIDIQHRRYRGVLIDVFYDHFLAINWHLYSSVELKDFTRNVYRSFIEYWDEIPMFPRIVIFRMMEQDWLGSYYYIAGVETTLKRIKTKLSQKHHDFFVVESFIGELENNYDLLNRDFNLFFPEIIKYLNSQQDYRSQ